MPRHDCPGPARAPSGPSSGNNPSSTLQVIPVSELERMNSQSASPEQQVRAKSAEGRRSGPNSLVPGDSRRGFTRWQWVLFRYVFYALVSSFGYVCSRTAVCDRPSFFGTTRRGVRLWRTARHPELHSVSAAWCEALQCRIGPPSAAAHDYVSASFPTFLRIPTSLRLVGPLMERIPTYSSTGPDAL